MPQICKVCLAQHDEEIHAATKRVQQWFHAQVTKHLGEAGDGQLPEDEQFAAPQLDAA